MDDARLAGEMTLEGIARQLEGIRSDLTDLKADVSGLKGDVSGLKADVTGLKADVGSLKGAVQGMDTRMTEGFRWVDEELNAAKIRDEALHGLMKFGLEAREALREAVDARFDATDRRHAQEIGLLQNVLARMSQAN